MITSKQGIDFVIAEEGNIPYAYYCQANVKTIGVGMVIKYLSKKQLALLEKVPFENVNQIGKILPAIEDDNTVYIISKDNCELILKEKLVMFENAINENISIELKPHEFDALISFAFNVGINNFKKSTLLKKINDNANATEIMKWFYVWNKGGGKILPVLIGRRKREASLFLNAKYTR